MTLPTSTLHDDDLGSSVEREALLNSHGSHQKALASSSKTATPHRNRPVLTLSITLNVVMFLLLSNYYVANQSSNYILETKTTMPTNQNSTNATTAKTTNNETANQLIAESVNSPTSTTGLQNSENGKKTNLTLDWSIKSEDVLSSINAGVIYGHIHMAKTAGTEINGELASHFERVCGHKGYSHDAYQLNLLYRRIPEPHSTNMETKDIVNLWNSKWNRGRVPMEVMLERGFEDCDYISLESQASSWKKVVQSLPSSWKLTLELHVPCRDPVRHLMSMCNHRRRVFNCAAGDLREEIQKCNLYLNRFSQEHFPQKKNLNLKCFQPIPIDPYLEYMGERLQRKRIENLYIHRDTNPPHNVSAECIWRPENKDVKKKVNAILLKDYDYYSWCQKCMGSKDDLLA